MFREVAVGIDGSSASRVAVEWAIARAGRERGHLTLVHVASASGRSGAETDAVVGAELEFARTFAPEIDVSIEIADGDPVRCLAEGSTGRDLLVVGTHKTGFLRGRAFGSIGPRLASAMQIPLAVVPARSGRARRGIVVGIDDKPRSLPLVRMAAADAATGGGELTVIHVQADGRHSPLGAALRLIGDEFPGLTVHARTVVGEASEVLVNAATTAECLFIGGADADRHGLGPIGYDVLLNIAGPTILVPPRGPGGRTADTGPSA